MRHIKRFIVFLTVAALLAGFMPQAVMAAEKVTPKQVEEAIELTLGYYSGLEEVSQDWEAFAINAVGGDPTEYGTGGRSYLALLEEQIEPGGVGGRMTDYERVTLGILSAGGNPSDFAGINLIERIYNWPDLSQGINAAVFGLIALDAANAIVPNGARNTRESLIRYILNNRSGNGWNYSGGSPDPDMTGMALYALAPYKDRQDVKTAGEKAIRWLSENQLEDGGYRAWDMVSSESIAQAICGVTAWEVDPQGALFTKAKGNLVTALLNFQIVKEGSEQGMFKHVMEAGGDPGFATNQGLYALGALKDYMAAGRSRIFYKIQHNKGEISSVELHPGGLELEKGIAFSLGVKNQNGNFVSNAEFDWSSTNPDIVSVDSQGALRTEKKGNATIVARLKTDGSIYAAQEVTVVQQEFTIERIDSDAGDGSLSGISFKITNGSAEQQAAVCMIGLFDKSSKALVQMNYVSKVFLPGQSHVFQAGFHMPAGSNYEIKVMVWDGWDRGRPLCEALFQ